MVTNVKIRWLYTTTPQKLARFVEKFKAGTGGTAIA